MDVNKEEKFKDERICPICLHVWSDPTVLDRCSHIFCFDCIIEWTRLKPECPLCKSAMQLVKHCLKDGGQSSLPNWGTSGQIENVIELRSEHELDQIMKVSAARAPDVEKHAIIQVAKSIMGELHSLRSLSITTYASESIYRRAVGDIDAELDEYKHLLNSINHGVSRAVLFNEPAFRRIIYKKNLMPNSICPPMFNVTFNKEYIQNHRETVRSHILPFVVREVTALTRKDALDIGTYLDRLLDYFTGKIKRQPIVTFLTKRGIENPHQFVNNLLHYASTGQTMKVYDQNSEYTQRRTNYVGNNFPEDDDVLFLNSNSDVEVIGESGGGRNWMQRARNRSPQNGEQPPMINNNLLLDHFQQQQPSTSATQQQEGGGGVHDSGILMSRMRQMLQNFDQQNRQQMVQQMADYFYTPPMREGEQHAPPHNQYEQQQKSNSQQSSSSIGVMDAHQRPMHSEADTDLRPKNESILLDDSDDGVECIGVVPKKRREMPETDRNNDGEEEDEEDELVLMDEDNNEE